MILLLPKKPTEQTRPTQPPHHKRRAIPQQTIWTKLTIFGNDDANEIRKLETRVTALRKVVDGWPMITADALLTIYVIVKWQNTSFYFHWTLKHLTSFFFRYTRGIVQMFDKFRSWPVLVLWFIDFFLSLVSSAVICCHLKSISDTVLSCLCASHTGFANYMPREMADDWAAFEMSKASRSR